MDVKVHQVSEVLREVEIAATGEDLRPHFEKAYQTYRNKLELKGFRKGKAPLELVKKLYGDHIEQDSLQEIATEFYRQAVKEKELKPIGEPSLVNLDYKPDEGFRCKIQYDVRPVVKLKDYKSIPVEKTIHTVTSEEVEAELLRLRRMNAAVEPAKKVAGDEYIVTADLQDIDASGIPVIGKRTENVRFYLSDEQLEQPFKDALKHAESGGAYRVSFEHKHGERTHAVNTEARVKKVERVVLPDLDASFVKKLTKDKIPDVETFRKSIHDDLIAYWRAKADREVVNGIIAEIIRRHDFQVPESLVRSVLDGLVEEIKNESPRKQLPADFDVEKFHKENRAYAIYQSKWALLREEIIKAEKVDVDDADLVQLAEAESAKIKIDKDRLIKYYRSSEQVKERLVGDKLIKLLVGSAKVKEVPEKPKSSLVEERI